MKTIARFKKLYKTSLLAIGLALILSGCTPHSTEPITDSGFYFDTVIQITLYDQSQQYALDHCMEMAATFEQYFSDTAADSDVSRINAHPNEAVTVHDETAELISRGLDYGKLSDGRFDITIGRLSDLWDFHEKTAETGNLPEESDEIALSDASSADVSESFSSDTVPSVSNNAVDASLVPDATEIADRLAHIDYTKIIVDGNQVTLLDPDAAIDLGGIAKGYIADKMKEYLESKGISSGLINLGGNVLTLGTKPNGDSYTIGIQKPFSTDGTPIVAVDVTDKSVVTSGTYQRYFEQDGRIYHHILDTSTGYPCDNGLSSVTLIGDSSTDGDALSTTVFLLGLDDGMNYVESQDNIEAIFITDKDEIYYSSGMGDVVPYREY